VNKLKEAWTLANEKAQERKNALGNQNSEFFNSATNEKMCYLADNLESWKIYEEKKVDCAKNLDMADAELKVIKHNQNEKSGWSSVADPGSGAFFPWIRDPDLG
jgi:hypothetical protein